jgi:tetratricopeptide (TPR) repeat protein
MSPNEAVPEGRAAVQKALELDPTLSEAHTFNAVGLAAYEWKWAEAESEFKRAIELDPKSSAAHFRYGQMYLLPTGRLEESIAEMKIALDMEPFDIVIASNYSWAHLVAGQNDKALEIAKKTYDLEPDHPQAQYYLAMAYNANGMYSDALTISEKELKVPDSQRFLEQAGIAYARSGRRERAEEIVKRFVEIGKTQFIVPYRVAALHVALGNRDEAFAWLEKAHQAHDWHLHRLKVDPQFAPLRGDPRYKDLLKRLNLPQ